MIGRPRRLAGGGTGIGLVWTVLFHAGMAALLVALVSAPESTPQVYAIDLVAAPAPTPRKRLAPEAIPEAQPPAPEPETAPVPDPEATVPEVKPKPTPPPPTPQRAPTPPAERDPTPATASNAEPAKDEPPSTGRDATTVKTPGLDFPFPEYLRNVANEIYRRWRRPTGNSRQRAEIFFLIHRDGSVSDLRFVDRSGSFSYDLEAQGAIEAAGKAAAFGPLPEGWQNDVLPISFYFEPRPN